MKRTSPNIVVVGGGISGCMAALVAAQGGASVTLVSPSGLFRATQGNNSEGLNSVLSSSAGHDSVECHIKDTLVRGANKAGADVVAGMCMQAPNFVGLFEKMGVTFWRKNSGLIESYRTSDSTYSRTVFVGPNTEHQIQRVLALNVLRLSSIQKIKLLDYFEFLSLIITETKACVGVTVLDRKNMEVKAMAADAIIICAGGYEGLFGRASTNPQALGACIGACARLGAKLSSFWGVDVSFLAFQAGNKCVYVGEHVLNAGARVLAIHDGKRSYVDTIPDEHFMSGETKYYLDIEDVSDEFVNTNLIDVLNYYDGISAAQQGEDKNLIPIRPAVTASLGGLSIDEGHATTIGGLFAAGPCTNLYHGKGILRGNGLLADVCGGKNAAQSALKFTKRATPVFEAGASLYDHAKKEQEDILAHLKNLSGGENVWSIKKDLCDVFEGQLGAFGDKTNCDAIKDKISEFDERLDKLTIRDKSDWANQELCAAYQLKNVVATVKAFLSAQNKYGEDKIKDQEKR